MLPLLLLIYVGMFFYTALAKDLILSLPDFLDTAASIKAFKEYGFFHPNPYFLMGNYTFFGSLPPLLSFLGSLLPLPPLVATTFLSITSTLIIAAFVVRKKLPLPIVLLLLINPYTSFLFPITWRVRQALALVFLLPLFYIKGWKRGIFYLLAFLAQPVIAALFWLAFSLKEMIEERKGKEILLGIVPFLLSLILVNKVLFYPLPMVGCQGFYLGEPEILIGYAIILFFLLHIFKVERKFHTLLFLFSLFPLLNALLFFLFPGVWEKIHLPLFSDLCIDGILVFVLTFFIMTGKVKSIKAATILASLLLLLSLLFLLLLPPLPVEKMINIKGKVITTGIILTNGRKDYIIHADFRYPSYSYLTEKENLFTDSPIPPQLYSPLLLSYQKICPGDYLYLVAYGKSHPKLPEKCQSYREGVRRIYVCNCENM